MSKNPNYLVNINSQIGNINILKAAVESAEQLKHTKDDYNTASTILTSINQIVTTNRAGVLDFFAETQKM